MRWWNPKNDDTGSRKTIFFAERFDTLSNVAQYSRWHPCIATSERGRRDPQRRAGLSTNVLQWFSSSWGFVKKYDDYSCKRNPETAMNDMEEESNDDETKDCSDFETFCPWWRITFKFGDVTYPTSAKLVLVEPIWWAWMKERLWAIFYTFRYEVVECDTIRGQSWCFVLVSFTLKAT